MEETLFIFDEKCGYLGEFLARQGALGSFALSKQGEEFLGESIREWQTRGLPILSEKMRVTDNGCEFHIFEERVMPREQRFGFAFRTWANMRTLRLVECRPGMIKCWEKMLDLPFEDQERYVLLTAVRRMEEKEMESWLKALDGARKEVAKIKA